MGAAAILWTALLVTPACDDDLAVWCSSYLRPDFVSYRVYNYGNWLNINEPIAHPCDGHRGACWAAVGCRSGAVVVYGEDMQGRLWLVAEREWEPDPGRQVEMAICPNDDPQCNTLKLWDWQCP